MLVRLIICILFTLCSLKYFSLTSCAAPKPGFGDSTHHPLLLDITIQVSFYGNQEVDPNILEIPFRLSGNLIVVEAEINDKKGLFILDSGAPELIINAKYLPEQPLGEEQEGLGITGSVAQVRLQHIDRFKWQEHELRKTKVKAIDLSHIEKTRNEEILGLIGFELFKDFEVFFDFKLSRVYLYKLDRAGNRLSLREEDRSPDYAVSFYLAGHVPLLKMKLGTNSLDFGLDTGAEMNILDIRSKSKVLRYFTIKKRGLLRGNGQDQVEILMGEIRDLELGELKFPPLKAILADLAHLNKAYGVQLDGVLGYHFLIQYQTAINFAKKEIYLWKPENVSTQK